MLMARTALVLVGCVTAVAAADAEAQHAGGIDQVQGSRVADRPGMASLGMNGANHAVGGTAAKNLIALDVIVALFLPIALYAAYKTKQADQVRQASERVLRTPSRWDLAETTAVIERVFRAVPQPATKEGEDAPTCAVCLMEMEAGESCRELQCAHRFHADCIMSWFASSPPCRVDCPLCRGTQRGLKRHCARGPRSAAVPAEAPASLEVV